MWEYCVEAKSFCKSHEERLGWGANAIIFYLLALYTH